MLTSRQAEILGIVLNFGEPNVNDIVRQGQSPTRLKSTLHELVQKRCLRMTPRGKKERRYSIMKEGFSQLTKYEADSAEQSFTRMLMRGQGQALKRILKHVMFWRVRCKNCGATSLGEGDKKVTFILRGAYIPEEVHCLGCGAQAMVITVEETREGRVYWKLDKSTKFIQEYVSVETALEE